MSLNDGAVQIAVTVSVKYLAFKEVDGRESANRWLNAFKTELDRQINAMEEPNPQMLKEAVFGAVSLIALNPRISDYPSKLEELKRTRKALQKLGR